MNLKASEAVAEVAASMCGDTPLRSAFRNHLIKVTEALREIEAEAKDRDSRHQRLKTNVAIRSALIPDRMVLPMRGLRVAAKGLDAALENVAGSVVASKTTELLEAAEGVMDAWRM